VIPKSHNASTDSQLLPVFPLMVWSQLASDLTTACAHVRWSRNVRRQQASVLSLTPEAIGVLSNGAGDGEWVTGPVVNRGISHTGVARGATVTELMSCLHAHVLQRAKTSHSSRGFHPQAITPDFRRNVMRADSNGWGRQ
jgi:hypothetical protein